jgi:hypothetical protein
MIVNKAILRTSAKPQPRECDLFDLKSAVFWFNRAIKGAISRETEKVTSRINVYDVKYERACGGEIL